MDNEYTVIGKPRPIGDAALKVTGQKIYVGDMELPGMLYAKVLLSTVPHARIKSIDTSAAEALPGVKAVATYKNTPQVRYNSAVRFIEHKLPDTERIFDDTVRFVGDRVAAVAAESPDIAKKAVNLIKVEYEALPVITDVEEAIKPEAWPIHEGGNIVGTSRAEAGNVDEAFQECDYVFEDRYTTQAIHHAAIEPHVAIADFAPNGKLTVYSPCQNTFAFRVIMSRIFGLSYNRIRMVAPAIGGAFGGKLEVTVEPVAAVLSQMTGKPVKVEYNRKESILSTRVRHASVNYVKTGFMKDGTLKAVDFKVYTNTGAYASSALNVSGAMSHKVFKAYKIDHMRFQCQPVYTNTEIAGAMRGYGSPQVYFGWQRQMQKIADFLHMDMADLQMKNMVDPDSCDPIFHKPHGNSRPKDCLKRALELIDYEACLKEQEATRNQDIRIGVGLALGVHGNNCVGAHRDVSTPMLKMNEDGSCIYYTGSHDMGTDTLGMQMQIVSEVLGISMDRIDCLAADTDVVHWHIGDYSSRGVFVAGSAAKKTAEAMKRELQVEAAKLLETEPDDIELHHDRAWSRKNEEKNASLHDVMVHCQSVSMRAPMLKMNEDGSCIYYTGSHDMGTDTLGMQMQIVSEVLGISMDRIDCLAADTDVVHWHIGDYSSRGVFVAGSAAKKTAEAMKRELQVEAAKLLETEPDDIELHHDRAWSRKNEEKNASLHDVMVHCQSVSMRELMVAETYEAKRGATSYGVHIAKVEVNTLTGEVRPLEYAAVHDIGRAINPLMLKGQLAGAIQMGLGYGLCEDMAYDGEGKPLVQTLKKYKVLRASQMPKLYMDFVETPQGEPDGPYGAKALGECPVVPAAPAVVNAICNAVRGEINELPARPDRVLAALGDK